MQSLVDFLKQFELMNRILQAKDLVENLDLCFVSLVVGVLVCLGYKMAAGKKPMMTWGPRLAVLTLLVHGSYQLAQAESWETLELVKIGARSAVLAGGVLAFTWIVFPIVFFVYSNLRVGVAAFLLYGGYALVTAPEWKSEQLPGIAARGLIASGLAVVLAWIFQPLLDLLPKRPPVEPPRPEPAKSEEPVEPRRRRRRRFPLLHSPWFHSDDDEVSRFQIEVRRRRDRARLTVELTYVLSMPDIGQQLPRDMFEQWVNRYMGDHLSAEEVEENSRQLQTLLAQQRKLVHTHAPSSSLEDLNLWLLEEERKIHALPLDEQARVAKLLDLHEHYVSLAQRMIGEAGQPAIVSLPLRPQLQSTPAASATS